jgi:signal transduction histidine kinase
MESAYIIRRYGHAKEGLERFRNTIQVFRINLYQGKGLGGLIAETELAALRGDNLARKIQENVDLLNGWFESIELAYSLSTREWHPVSSSGLPDMIHTSVERCRALFPQRGISVSIENMEFTDLFLSEGHETAFEEILTNALKYAPENTIVNITSINAGLHREIMVISDIEKNEGGVTGIPSEYEEVIYEPFRRLNNFYDERFSSEKIGSGLGLTVCENIALKNEGYIRVREGLDYATGDTPRKRIIATIGVRRA